MLAVAPVPYGGKRVIPLKEGNNRGNDRDGYERFEFGSAEMNKLYRATAMPARPTEETAVLDGAPSEHRSDDAPQGPPAQPAQFVNALEGEEIV